jgi:hypothetical protein
MIMAEKEELSCVTISRTRRDQTGYIQEKYVQVKNHDIKVCKETARELMKEMR